MKSYELEAGLSFPVKIDPLKLEAYCEHFL